MDKVNLFQNKIMRLIANKRQINKVSIEKLVEMTNHTSLIRKIKTQKIKFFQKVKNLEKGVSKVCVEGFCPGKRSRGRPRRRWIEDIKEWTNSNHVKDALAKVESGIITI